MVSAKDLREIVNKAQCERIKEEQRKASEQQRQSLELINNFIKYIVDDTQILQEEAQRESTQKTIVFVETMGGYSCEEEGVDEEYNDVYRAYRELESVDSIMDCYDGISVTFHQHDLWDRLSVTFDWS